MEPLSPQELNRYSRHLVLKEVGLEGQLKLKNASVLVVGAGGLGSPVLLYLAAAGVGRIGVVDDDVVAISNLQRQVLFTMDDVGSPKAAAAVIRLRKLNPHIWLEGIPKRIDSANATEITGPFDVVVDCTDNFATRYLLNDTCVLLGKPLVYGSILRFEGHVSVFNLVKPDGTRSTNYRDLFPEPPDPQSVQNCEEAGVLGILPGLVGSWQANEVIKIICGIGQPLADRLLIIDTLDPEQTLIAIPDRQARNSIKSLIDYEEFCGLNQNKSKSWDVNQNDDMKEVTVQELQKLKQSNADFQLIDVREPHEYELCNLDGELIPMSEIPYNVDKISKDKQVILHCRSGKRSGDMLLWLEKNHGFNNLYNLKGGILAWAKEIDPSMPTY